MIFNFVSRNVRKVSETRFVIEKNILRGRLKELLEPSKNLLFWLAMYATFVTHSYKTRDYVFW